MKASLPAAEMRVRRAVTAALDAHVPRREGELLILAVSGGVDSMVLLDVLAQLRAELSIRLHVAHLDHRLREESLQDRMFVQDRARAYGLPCTWAARDVRARMTGGRSLEEAARQVRYAFLEEVAQAQGARYLVLGHHAGDQAETVLLRLLRGSGSSGLSGMRVLRDGRYVRPMLALTREEILRYAASRALPYREDASNADPRFVRNRVRHQLLPVMRGYNPQVDAALRRTAALLADEDDFLEREARQARHSVVPQRWLPGMEPGWAALDVRRLLEYHIAIRRRVVRALLADLTEERGGADFRMVSRVLAMAGGRAGPPRALGGNVLVQRSRDRLLLGRAGSVLLDVEVPVPGEVVLAHKGLRLKTRLSRPEEDWPLRETPGCLGAAAFDREQAGRVLRLRSPRRGDVFQPHGMRGHKKLSDFLIDIKWPRALRPGLLLLTDGQGRILWVVGLRTAQCTRITGCTRELIVAELWPAERAGTQGPVR